MQQIKKQNAGSWMRRWGIYYLQIIFLCLSCIKGAAQSNFVSEKVLAQLSKVSASLPANIHVAYKQYEAQGWQFDSLEKTITDAYPALADKAQRRSNTLNSMAGYSTENAISSLLSFDQKFSDYFLQQWDRFDALEKVYNARVKTFYGKELYKTQGYLAVWDSAYQIRLPALTHYRDGVLKLAQSEIAYLKANRHLLKSKEETVRIQYVEAEVKILQQLIYLKTKLQQVVVEDGINKVKFCMEHPGSCDKK